MADVINMNGAATENTTVEEPKVENVESNATQQEPTTEAPKAEVKKENFVTKWWNSEKAEWKAHPVKKTFKTIGKTGEAVLAGIGVIALIDTFKPESKTTEVIESVQDHIGENITNAITDKTTEN